MKRLMLSTLGVWLLTLYPVWELTKMILIWRRAYAIDGDWQTAFEIGFIWMLYLAIPLGLWLTAKVTNEVTRMAHECEICGQECYCDMDDCGGFEQPGDCMHFLHHKETGGDCEYDIGLDTEDE